MLKYVSLLLLLLLVGCKSEPIYINRTVEKLVEVIKECPKVCPMNVCEYDCPDCILKCYEPECKTTIKTVSAQGCTQKLNICNVRVDQYNDELYKCLQANSTNRYEDLRDNLTGCISDRDQYKEELEEIRDLVS